MKDEELAELIRRDGVDILVDLMQHTADNRLLVFVRRPAPVQVSFAAYPGSTGVASIAHRISDPYLEAETYSCAEEVHLIDSFWCYRDCAEEVQVNELPAKERGHVTFGNLGNFAKINEAVLKLWARVLDAVKGSRLVILSGRGSQQQRTLEVLRREGIDASRVEMIEPRSHVQYLELYHRLDIVLDTFPYNGHTTSLDALWMGTPVVSLAGDTQVSRGGLSILTNVGLPDLVTRSKEEYVETAVRLAGNLSRLDGLRATLRTRMESSALMGAARFARNIENAYRTMWRRWCATKEQA
jgi:predicted O-linked N-acetylglucosamine transferase (SPINDLY family)